MLRDKRVNAMIQGAKSEYQRGLRLAQGGSMIVKALYILPAAIRCFFHVYEERLGTYGFRVRRHVLISPEKTGCERVIDLNEHVTVGNDIIVDRTWCRSCVAAVDAESKRGHSPEPLLERNT
jgi:hypothetical protein